LGFLGVPWGALGGRREANWSPLSVLQCHRGDLGALGASLGSLGDPLGSLVGPCRLPGAMAELCLGSLGVPCRLPGAIAELYIVAGSYFPKQRQL
jgi:hypothetical protein